VGEAICSGARLGGCLRHARKRHRLAPLSSSLRPSVGIERGVPVGSAIAVPPEPVQDLLSPDDAVLPVPGLGGCAPRSHKWPRCDILRRSDMKKKASAYYRCFCSAPSIIRIKAMPAFGRMLPRVSPQGVSFYRQRTCTRVGLPPVCAMSRHMQCNKLEPTRSPRRGGRAASAEFRETERLCGVSTLTFSPVPSHNMSLRLIQ
jgi:hypothetical protein